MMAIPLYNLANSPKAVYRECRRDGHCLYVEGRILVTTIMAIALTVYLSDRNKVKKKD